jgi:predicted nucleic acid-binding protein
MADAERPEPRPGILYVDTSALLKLLVREAESEAVEIELLRWSKLATSVVTEVELPRAVARAREERSEAVIDGSVVLQGVLASAAIVPLGAGIVAKARDVSPVHVGTLDAIHVCKRSQSRTRSRGGSDLRPSDAGRACTDRGRGAGTRGAVGAYSGGRGLRSP